MKEEWRDIKGYEGYYQVSNLGRVKSLSRIVQHKRYGTYPVCGKALKPSKQRQGYLMAHVCINNRKKGVLIHRLVASAFIPNPHDKKTVNHKDGDKANNHVSNLEWATQSENIIHAFSTGLQKPNCGIKNGHSKPVIQMDLDGNIISKYHTAREAFKMTGVFWGTISDVCNNKTKTAGGYKWSFK